MRKLLIIIAFLPLFNSAYSQIVINEFCSSNLNGLKDENGDFSDWIELYNNSQGTVNLGGYFLSDSPLSPGKWQFPSISLKKDSFLLVYASGKNRASAGLAYQTIIPKGATWKYKVPDEELGDAWRISGYDVSSWNSSPSGFGYGDNDDATVLSKIMSVFIRKEFTVDNLDDVEEIILSIDYDDGFVAYINGHEIARSNLGTPGSFVAFNQPTGSFLREATMYNGGLPETFQVFDAKSILVNGTNVIAIQGHNSDANSTDLSLIPILSLGMKGTGYVSNIPSYVKVPKGNLHTNFKISADGETLLLSAPDSSYVDSVAAIALKSDISYGRKPNGTNSWFYFINPTPLASNSTKGYSEISGSKVNFSYQGGYFPGGLSLHLSTENSSDSIYYTTDGSDPDKNDILYKNPISISKNTVLRARTISATKLPGQIYTNTYYTKQYSLPVVCLSTEPANFFDWNTGIYVLGPNAQSTNPNFGANFWEDWEKPVHIEYYDKEGIKQIDQDGGVKIFGAYSRANAQKSLALFARKEYGTGAFKYKFFEDKPITEFESLVLRNSGNDWNQGFVRDGLTTSSIKKMDIDRQAYQPVVVFINAEYWGIQELREKVNPNYFAENHAVDPEKVTLLESNGTALEGSSAEYTQIINYLNTHTLENENDYLNVSNKLDLDNYIQYQLTQIYIYNHDWPGNNIKFWKTSDPGSLWRWVIYDTDFGWGIWDDGAYTNNSLLFALKEDGTEWPNPAWSTLMLRRMMTSQNFRYNFANQFADRINTDFTAEKLTFLIDSLKTLFDPEIDDQMLRWGLSKSNWENNYTSIKKFIYYRPTYMRIYLNTYLATKGRFNINIEIPNAGSGKVKINTVIPDTYPFKGEYFKGIPIKLTAIPEPGYVFSRWEGTTVSTNATIDFDMSGTATFRAIFDVAPPSAVKMVINEIKYSSAPDKDTKDWIELFNAGSTPVNLKNWVISDNAFSDGFMFLNDIIVEPGEYYVVCHNMTDFREFHSKVLNSTGDFVFGLSSEGDDVNLYNPEGILMDFVNYTSNAPWPTDAVGTGASIELTDPGRDNNMGSNWRSSFGGGSPGKLNFLSIPMNNTTEPKEFNFKLTCFPNPFGDYTSIRIEVENSGEYKLEVYDLQGRLINILADQFIQAGAFYIDWDGKDSGNELMPGGIYIIRLSGTETDMRIKVVKLN